MELFGILFSIPVAFVMSMGYCAISTVPLKGCMELTERIVLSASAATSNRPLARTGFDPLAGEPPGPKAAGMSLMMTKEERESFLADGHSRAAECGRWAGLRI